MIVEYVDLYGRDGVLFILTCVHTLQSVFYSDCNLSVPHIKLGTHPALKVYPVHSHPDQLRATDNVVFR